MPNPFAPPGESAADLWAERSNFSGEVLCAVAYGIHITVFSICAYYLVLNIRYKRGDRNIHFLVYTFILFFLGTLIIAGNTKFAEEIWIDDRNVPGGPVAWLIEHYSDPANIMMCGSYVAANFFTDGILLWRAYTFWNSVYVIIIPFIIYCGSTAMSIMSVYFASRPGSSLWTPDTVKVTIAYFSMSIALNLILTILIVGRLLYLSRSVKAILGESHAKTYTSVAAMMIESAAPLSLTSIVFIITYGLGSNVQNLVLPILSQVLCISPELIILRVARGQGWTAHTAKTTGRDINTSPMVFRSPPVKVSITATSASLSDVDTPQGTPMKPTNSFTVAEFDHHSSREASGGDIV